MLGVINARPGMGGGRIPGHTNPLRAGRDVGRLARVLRRGFLANGSRGEQRQGHAEGEQYPHGSPPGVPQGSTYAGTTVVPYLSHWRSWGQGWHRERPCQMKRTFGFSRRHNRSPASRRASARGDAPFRVWAIVVGTLTRAGFVTRLDKTRPAGSDSAISDAVVNGLRQPTPVIPVGGRITVLRLAFPRARWQCRQERF